MDFHVQLIKPKKKTLAEQTYDILYTGIINGEICPGDELIEQQLAEMLQVSRTPVREALMRLKAMDLLEGSSYSKMTVKKTSREEIDEVMDLRALLEIHILGETVANCTQEDIVVLEGILEKSRVEMQADNLLHLLDLNTQFHETLNKISGKKMAISMLSSLRNTLNRYRVWSIGSGYNKRNYDGHLRLVEALKNKDREKALEEMTQHMYESKRAALDGLSYEENER